MATIRIDQDVYNWLKSKAEPFEDTPNSVLRRLAGLDKPNALSNKEDEGKRKGTLFARKRGKRLSGKYLSKLWNVNVKHALYHEEGTFYENLRAFPGALFDYNGYKVFQTENDYNQSPYLVIGQKLNVHGGISSIPGYIHVKNNHLRDNSSQDSSYKHDPQEDDPRLKKIIEAAGKEAEEVLNNHERYGKLGVCVTFWLEQKRILREKYGIEWKTPGE
jgi:hypothetical protein